MFDKVGQSWLSEMGRLQSGRTYNLLLEGQTRRPVNGDSFETPK